MRPSSDEDRRRTWRIRFESTEELEVARLPIMKANEENFDRLAVRLAMLAW
jgi:hypothetical protein